MEGKIVKDRDNIADGIISLFLFAGICSAALPLLEGAPAEGCVIGSMFGGYLLILGFYLYNVRYG